MDSSIYCFNCKENYIVDVLNTVLDGPIIKTECPFCYKKIERNFSKFVESQIDKHNKGLCERARMMIDFAKGVEKKVFVD